MKRYVVMTLVVAAAGLVSISSWGNAAGPSDQGTGADRSVRAQAVANEPGAFEPEFLAEKLARDRQGVRPGSGAAAFTGPSVQVEALPGDVPVFRVGDDGLTLVPNHPPLDQIPPAPMGEPVELRGPNVPSGLTFYDAKTGTTVVLPVEGEAAEAGDAPKQLAGFEGVLGGFDTEEISRTFWDMTKITNTTDLPWRMNAKLVMRFVDQANNDRWFGCSGSMVDAETVLCAGHCTYLREVNGPDIFNWAQEIWVYPGKDGSDHPYGYGHGTYFAAGTDWINYGDFNADAGMIRITRAVGVLTGWFGNAWDGSCGWIQGHTYYNASYPGETCPIAGLHNGEDMYYWGGNFDSCPGNQLQINTGGGHCYDTVWGGMSGSGAFYIDGGRYVHAVCSNSDRMWVGRYCKLWGAFADYLNNTFIPGSRGGTFDLQALDANAEPASIPAGRALSSASFLAINPTNGSANGTWTVRTYLSTNDDISASDTLLGTGTFGWDFGPMNSVWVNLGGPTIPVSTPPGNYWFGVDLDPGTDIDRSNNSTDGWDAVPITVTPAPPPNDFCSAATVITTSPYDPPILDTRGATSADSDPLQNCTSGGPNRNSNTVWYTYVPPCNGLLNVDTCGTGPSYDTVLSVFTGTCGSLTEIACSDDACGYQSQISNLAVTAFQRLYIEVSDYNAPLGGNLDFHLDFVGTPPANDECEDAIHAAVPSSNVGWTACATADGAPFCGTAQNAPGVWYKVWGTGKTMTATTCNEFSTFNTRINVYCGGCDTLTCVAGNDDNCTSYSSTLSKVSWCSQAGTYYWVLVHGAGGQTGGFILDIWDNGVPCSGAVECGGQVVSACCAGWACEEGGVCGQLKNCGGSHHCFCFQAAEGGPSCSEDFWCNEATPCPNGSGDCAAGQVCLVNTCCGGPVCALAGCPQVQERNLAEPEPGDTTAAGGSYDANTDAPQRGDPFPYEPCQEVVQTWCDAFGNLYQGDGVACANTICPGPTGACCRNGVCIGTMAEPECLGQGGQWFAGENCDDGSFTCPQPPPTGACCAPWVCTEGFVCGGGRLPVCDGSFAPCVCFTLAEGELECLNAYQPCGPPCNATAECGAGYACVVNSCCVSGDKLGACLVAGCPGTDVKGDTSAVVASDLLGDDRSEGAIAAERGTAPQNCIEVEQLACDAYVALYQGDNTTCADTDCPGPPQACCMPDGSCIEVEHQLCVMRGGDPQGPDTICANRRCSAIKWAQPPMFNANSQYPECFWGWDETTWYDGQQIVADDWPCMTDQAVTDIHWWGSYLQWDSPTPPPIGPVSFHIGIWKDVSGGIPFSHPGTLIHEWVVDRRALNERAVGCDFYPEHSTDTCFRYDFRIPSREWFQQGPSCEIFWVSISAIYEGTLVRNPWGWKTRKHTFADAAVRIFAPTAPREGSEYRSGEPILTGLSPRLTPWDMAFVLTTVLRNEACCLPDGGCINEPPNECQADGGRAQGAGSVCTQPRACCLEDGSCIMVDPLCCDEFGGVVEEAGAACSAPMACCLPDGTCQMMDPLCCLDRGGTSMGPDSQCTAPEGCCLPGGACKNLDPLCCELYHGFPQGAGTACVDATLACCDPDSGRCRETNPLCCDDIGGVPSPIGSPVCLGDANQNEIDDACEVPPQACCLPDGTCQDLYHDDCVRRGGDPQGPLTTCNDRVCPRLKWAQPPTFNPDSPEPDCFWGWDEMSWYRGQQIVADDWLCDSTRPISDVHWWGSYYRWDSPVPPQEGPTGFHIGIWKDVTGGTFSHPGTLIHEWVVDRRAVNERAVGCDFFPDHPRDTCFRYDLILPREKWFFQGPVCEVYWISIAAIYPPDYLSRNFWGWKTRRHMFNDAAVRISDPTAPREGSEYRRGEPILTGSVAPILWDMAFVLTSTRDTEACCLRDQQCLDVIREVCLEMNGKPQGAETACTEPQACCLRSGECIMVDPLCCDEFGGTAQGEGTECTREVACCLPDASCRMLDPLCCEAQGGAPQAGAVCTGELACCLPDGSCEMLDPLCCAHIGGEPVPNYECGPTQGCCLSEGACKDLDPVCCRQLGGVPQGPGSGCVDTTMACCLDDGQRCTEVDPLCCDELRGFPSPIGSPVCLGDDNGNHLDDACEFPPGHQACCMPDGTCRDINHMACVELGGDPQGPFTVCDSAVIACRPLKWSQPPVLNSDSPLAACFWGWDEPSVFAGRQIVADDWKCDSNRPVTDVHWWGSYKGWGMLEPPQGAPGRFHVGIWTDVPRNVDLPFSHPGRLIRNWIVPREALRERPVGCDFYPQAGVDTCFRYDLDLPEDVWFYQGETCEIFWVSIAAVYPSDGIPSEFVWGWKTRPHHWNDDAVRIFVPTDPANGVGFQEGEPIHDVTGMSWDMAFVLTTDCPQATIADSRPRNGTVDARQPCKPDSALPRQGIGAPGELWSVREPITIWLQPPVPGAEHCFELCETKADPLLGPNSIRNVTDLGGGRYEIVLHHAITAGAVTTIQYTGDGSFVTYISHPANVNADSASAPSDILRVIDYLNHVAVSPWGIYTEDVDRSNLLAPPDILRVIDLLNGAGVYDPWLNTPLPRNPSCP